MVENVKYECASKNIIYKSEYVPDKLTNGALETTTPGLEWENCFFHEHMRVSRLWEKKVEQDSIFVYIISIKNYRSIYTNTVLIVW